MNDQPEKPEPSGMPASGAVWPPPPSTEPPDAALRKRGARRYRNLGGFTGALVFLLILNSVLDVSADVYTFIWSRNLFVGYFEIPMVSAFLFFCTVVAFLVWTYFAYANLYALDRKPRDWPGSVVTYFLLPVVGLYLPHRVFCELLILSSKNNERPSQKPVTVWWGSWLAYAAIGAFGFIGIIDSARVSLPIAVVKGLLSCLGTALASYLVMTIARRQRERHDELSGLSGRLPYASQ